MVDVKEAIGQCIKRWREFKNMKQETLASELGISKAAVSHIETGKSDITVSRIERVAAILQIDLLELMSTPQQVMHASQNSNQANGSENAENSGEDEVIKLLQEELQIKNKQLDQIMSALNKCLTNSNPKTT